MMLSREQRKEAANQFKERKSPRGIFAVRCSATGQVWVGASRDLAASRNSTWFSLRIGSHRDPELQAAWNVHGPSAFEYEVLETLKDDVSPLLLADLLKDSKGRWRTELGARTLL